MTSQLFVGQPNQRRIKSRRPNSRACDIFSIFSCPEQLNRWPCPLLALTPLTIRVFTTLQRIVTLENCDLRDIWSEWWGGDMTWLKKTYLPTHVPHTYPPTYLPNFFITFSQLFFQLSPTFPQLFLNLFSTCSQLFLNFFSAFFPTFFLHPKGAIIGTLQYWQLRTWIHDNRCYAFVFYIQL